MTDLPKIGAPATRALEAIGYRSLESLAGVDRSTLLALHGFGPRAERIVDEALTAAALPQLTDGRR
ncbi:helix-hairpin-helix domain-containing protein [Antrihabitans cavernicola]|uniref:Helix-hairpin-helix domain-containing protein n=1 Tax=Antrihabitans cavernicola TaxID=2495913 RepID=A0A5A7S8V5_9NOCA|nr:helix-hairpin-helix domain-containing protein [Spelaeibacter cavernicola]KAA0021347.1 helix-hairpin-helix domain-containing protein [Spelaeibacter cavernicola]